MKRLFYRWFKQIIKGNGIRAAWKYIWKEIDRIFGFLIREVYKYTVKIDNNKVFFFTQEFRYCCNPKYICEELIKTHPEVEIVWRVNEPKIKSNIPDYCKKVQVNTLEYFRELYSSRVIVANSYIFHDQTTFLKRKQVLFQTWHGSLGIKKYGVGDRKGYIRQLFAIYCTGKMTNYFITNGTFVSLSIENIFKSKSPKLEYGHPRNDVFFDNYQMKRDENKKEFCKNNNLSIQTKFVLYAPTFRNDMDFYHYDIDYDRLAKTIKKRFKGDWCILLRYHPSFYEKNKSKVDELISDKYINVTNYTDIQELLTMVDIGITDYSSWIYDFVLTRKPCFIYANDIESYDQERGFCYPLETTPFSISKNNEELEKNIELFDNCQYKTKVEQFLLDKGCVDDGFASKRVVKKIIKELQNE